MGVSDYKFSENEILNLQQYRDNQPDVRLKVRFMALLLLSKGLEHKDVASVIHDYRLLLNRNNLNAS
jgi:hypothetical protein